MTRGYRTIVAPVDFSPGSESALGELEHLLARDARARLHLVHVVEPIAADMGIPPALWTDVTAQLEAAARQQIETVAARLGKRLGRGVRVETHVLRDMPHDAICRLADKLAADLIVIGTHGRTGLKRVLLGSVAERVVRHAGRPVLAVPLAARRGRG
jgi:nucleotide-binding universal stress UspA family protein